MLTIGEHFDPNDKEKPKTPMEFKVYPVDLLSKISTPYSDDLYDNFIKESKTIFESYNDFLTYIANKENQIRISSLESYNFKDKEGYIECRIYDKDDNCYLLKINSPTNYAVMLDEYTIESEKYIEEYNNASEDEKINLII